MAEKVIKYVGRTTNFKGKTLWEIVGNLKNFGVGRIVVRSTFERYPEPSYMKIVKVEALPEEEIRKCRVWVEKTFRGQKLPKTTVICGTSYKPDYKLIHKHDEADYCQMDTVFAKEKKILPKEVELPPLLKEFIIMESQRKGTEKVLSKLKTPLSYNWSPNRTAHLAQSDDEAPTIDITMGIGKPVSPSLYEGINIK